MLKGGAVPLPRWILALRAFQLFFAILIIALTAYGLSIYSGGPVSFSISPIPRSLYNSVTDPRPPHRNDYHRRPNRDPNSDPHHAAPSRPTQDLRCTYSTAARPVCTAVLARGIHGVGVVSGYLPVLRARQWWLQFRLFRVQ